MRLVINNGKAKGQAIKVTGQRFLIGRDSECQLRPRSDEVSGRHAELKVVSGIPLVVDLGSAGGTRVNGRPLTGSPVVLHNGDHIEVGPLRFTILLDGAGRPKRPRRATEDEVVSWLIEEEDDEPTSSWTRQAPLCGEAPSTRETAPSTRSALAGRPPEAGHEGAFELLRAMTVRPE